MDLGRREVTRVEWADLPAELLAIIYGELPNCREMIGFRSVCRWWRLSTPPPLNRLSGVFPLKPSFLGEPSSRFDFVINASAVYLVSPRADPCKAWMVSVQEASPGELVLRHALYHTQHTDTGTALDLDWISATHTPIARSYAHNERCRRCTQVARTQKVAFVREPKDSSSACHLVGLCGYPFTGLFAFRIQLSDSATPTASQFHADFLLQDVEAFDGRVFAIDYVGHICLLDHTSLKLIQMHSVTHPQDSFLRFVVSDGNLYLVLLRCEYDTPHICHIYRLQVVTNPSNQTQILLVEEVHELGDDTVFFVGMTFSVPARHLPPPWKGNCIVFGDFIPGMCECKAKVLTT